MSISYLKQWGLYSKVMYIYDGELYAFEQQVKHTNIAAYDYYLSYCIYYTDEGWVHLVSTLKTYEFIPVCIPGAFDIYLMDDQYLLVFPNRLEIYSYTGKLKHKHDIIVEPDFRLFIVRREGFPMSYINGGKLYNYDNSVSVDIPECKCILDARLAHDYSLEMHYIDYNDNYCILNYEGSRITNSKIRVLANTNNGIVYGQGRHSMILYSSDTRYAFTTQFNGRPIECYTNGYQWILVFDNIVYYHSSETCYSIPYGSELFRSGHHAVWYAPIKSAKF